MLKPYSTVLSPPPGGRPLLPWFERPGKARKKRQIAASRLFYGARFVAGPIETPRDISIY
mgnify:CR=1 FL=1